jgi:hypothetical protein
MVAAALVKAAMAAVAPFIYSIAAVVTFLVARLGHRLLAT